MCGDGTEGKERLGMVSEVTVPETFWPGCL